MEDGLKKDVLIKSGNYKEKEREYLDEHTPIKDLDGTMFGRVWAGYAAFPDWSNPEAEEYWIDQLNKYHAILPFDGLWLDMNEIANFDAGPSIPEDKVPSSRSVMAKIVYTPGERDLEQN